MIRLRDNGSRGFLSKVFTAILDFAAISIEEHDLFRLAYKTLRGSQRNADWQAIPRPQRKRSGKLHLKARSKRQVISSNDSGEDKGDFENRKFLSFRVVRQ